MTLLPLATERLGASGSGALVAPWRVEAKAPAAWGVSSRSTSANHLPRGAATPAAAPRAAPREPSQPGAHRVGQGRPCRSGGGGGIPTASVGGLWAPPVWVVTLTPNLPSGLSHTHLHRASVSSAVNWRTSRHTTYRKIYILRQIERISSRGILLAFARATEPKSTRMGGNTPLGASETKPAELLERAK